MSARQGQGQPMRQRKGGSFLERVGQGKATQCDGNFKLFQQTSHAIRKGETCERMGQGKPIMRWCGE